MERQIDKLMDRKTEHVNESHMCTETCIDTHTSGTDET